MKKQLLFIALCVTTFLNAQSITITSAITTAEAGSTVTVDYTYTSTNASNYIYCGLNLYTETTWESFVVGGEAAQSGAGTEVTGSISFTIPSSTALTADLASLENYKISIEMKEDTNWTLLADDYPTTELTIVAAGTPSTDSIKITPAITTAEVGSTITVNYKYTSTAPSNYIYCAINTYSDETFDVWKATVVSGEATASSAGTDVTGSFSFTIPADLTLSSDLVSPENYKISIEMKEDSGWSLVADEFPTAEIAIVAAGTLSTNDVQTKLNNITVYPNPTKNTLQIKGVNSLDISNVKIVNILGKEVYSFQLKNSNIDVSNLNAGIYIVTIQADTKFKRMKFIKN